MKDRVFQMRDGWYCMVGGKTFGAWALRGYSVAGMQVEQRRLAAREREILTKAQWDETIKEFCGLFRGAV